MDINEITGILGITALSEMQKETISVFGERTDLVLLSPTGSGKTLAYLLPLTECLNEQNDYVQTVILSPTRELALQIVHVFQSMKTPFRVMGCYGGHPAMEEHRMMKQIRPQLLVVTPGRLCDHIRKQNISLAHVHYLIVDEFDKCLELGFRKEMSFIMEELPPIRKNVFTSATDSEEINDFICKGKRVENGKRIRRIDYLNVRRTADNISQYVVMSPDKDKIQLLGRLLLQLEGKPTIVFVNYRESVMRVYQYLKERNFCCVAFHGAMEQDERERALGKFRNGSNNILVSTDLSSRGLDIPEVANVVHYHIPVNRDTYVHRIGRSSRWETKGNSYLLLHAEETCPDYVDASVLDPCTFDPKKTKPVQPQWITIYIGKGKKDKISKGDIVGFICKKGNARIDDIGMIEIRDYYTYVAIRRTKSREILVNIQNEKIKGKRTIYEIMK